MDWLTCMVPGHAPDGAPILSVLGKRTYRIANGQAVVPDEAAPLPFTEADEYWGQGNPAQDAMKFESDLIAYKPMTDVIVIGSAWAPRGKKAYYLDAGIQVGTAKKLLRVFGDRHAYMGLSGLAFSDPQPFERIPLDYSQAYGGRDEKSDPSVPLVYPRNPVGKGFVVKNDPKAVQDLALPNLENPRQLLQPGNLAVGKFERWPDMPQPWALGYTSKNFHPRFTYAGLAPDQQAAAEMERQRNLQKMPEIGSGPAAQPPPPSPVMNLQFYNGASSGMCFPYLVGDEPIRLAYLDADFPQFSFQLPGTRPRAWMDVGEGPEEMPMVLHTVILHKDTNQLAMIWRGSVYYSGPESMKEFKGLEYGVKG